jgi:hypothetical protein
MSKRNIDALKDNTQATARRSRNPSGFRVARPPATQSASRSTAASSSSTLANSRIRTLVVGSNGRLAGRRKDRSHLTTPANIQPTSPNQPEDANVIPSEIDDSVNVPEDAIQETCDVPAASEPKRKRKRNNNTRVWNFFTELYFPD